jgi:hypothetical protein
MNTHRLPTLLLTLLASLNALTARVIAGETALYDNLSFLVRNEENALGPSHNLGASAQLFTTGETGSISSVTIWMGIKGNPGGHLRVEIWDRDGETPGNKVTEVSQIDLTSLAPISSGGEAITFTPNISELSPSTPYYLLIENTTATIPGDDDTYIQFFASTAAGTGESAQLIVRPTPGNWVPIDDTAERWILRITEPSTPQKVIWNNGEFDTVRYSGSFSSRETCGDDLRLRRHQ